MTFWNKILRKHFLLNVHTKEVHYLRNEKPACSLKLMSKKNKKYLTKRKALELIKSGKANGCRWCMPQVDTDMRNVDMSNFTIGIAL